MWKVFAMIFLAVASFAASLSETRASKVDYKTKGGSYVLVHSAKRPEATPESTVEFYSPDNQRLCSLDFSSEDGEHGFGVVKAAWTSDENYFVFSLTSSGGHQAWHAPTVFFIWRNKEIRTLDSFTSAAGISQANFTLQPPNIVLTEVWQGQAVPVKFKLDSLANDKRKSPKTLLCTNGEVFRVDPYDLQNHD